MQLKTDTSPPTYPPTWANTKAPANWPSMCKPSWSHAYRRSVEVQAELSPPTTSASVFQNQVQKHFSRHPSHSKGPSTPQRGGGVVWPVRGPVPGCQPRLWALRSVPAQSAALAGLDRCGHGCGQWCAPPAILPPHPLGPGPARSLRLGLGGWVPRRAGAPTPQHTPPFAPPRIVYGRTPGRPTAPAPPPRAPP